MERKQLLKVEDHTITVTITGNSWDDTVGKIFTLMRKEIFNKIGKPIVQMDTKEVYFDDVQIKETTEKFLFLFMPRVKRYFTVKATIVLSVKYIDLEKEEI